MGNLKQKSKISQSKKHTRLWQSSVMAESFAFGGPFSLSSSCLSSCVSNCSGSNSSNPPQAKRRKTGGKKNVTTTESVAAGAESEYKKIKCGRCKQFGHHNRRSCSAAPAPNLRPKFSSRPLGPLVLEKLSIVDTAVHAVDAVDADDADDELSDENEGEHLSSCLLTPAEAVSKESRWKELNTVYLKKQVRVCGYILFSIRRGLCVCTYYRNPYYSILPISLLYPTG